MKHSIRNISLSRILFLVFFCLVVFITAPALADKLVIPDQVETIEEEAFFGDGNVYAAALPDGLKAIGPRAFRDTNLRYIRIPESVDSIADDAFPESNAYLVIDTPRDSYAWSWAVSHGYKAQTCLVSGGLIYSVTDAGAVILGDAGAPADLVIPETIDGTPVVSIEAKAFMGHTGLRSVRLPDTDTLTQIGYEAFSGCTNIASLYMTHVPANGCHFENLTGLKEVTIPVDMDTRTPFSGCTNVETIHYTPGKTNRMPDRTIDNYTSRYNYQLQYYSRAKLKRVDYAEGITHIGAYAFYDGEESEYIVETIHLPVSLESIGAYAFYNLCFLPTVRLDENCKTIGAYNFSGCPEILVSVYRFNTDAAAWLFNNRIPYYFGRYLNVQLHAWWKYELETKPIFIFPEIDGGLKPYTYRFSYRRDDDPPVVLDWQEEDEVLIPVDDPEEHDWYVRIEVRDSEGTAAQTNYKKIEKFNDPTDRNAFWDAFIQLVDAAPERNSLRGYMLDENMEDSQWLNTAMDLLHLDLSFLNSANEKQEYLFEQAFQASAAGSRIRIMKKEELPECFDVLAGGVEVSESQYLNMAGSLLREGYNVKALTQAQVSDLFQNFDSGDLSGDQLTDMLKGQFYGLSHNQAVKTKDAFETMKKAKRIRHAIEYVGAVATAAGMYFDIYNKIELLDAMNPSAVRSIIEYYRSMQYLTKDPAYGIAADKLASILANRNNKEAQIAQIIGDELANTGIEMLLDLISASDKHPGFAFAYCAVDYLLGTGSYSKAMRELQWSSDSLYDISLLTSEMHYRWKQTDEKFEDMLYAYANYLELAAAVEEAYVQVVKWQQETPLIGLTAPDYLNSAKAQAATKAEKLRLLAAKVVKLDALYKEENFAEGRLLLETCLSDQEELKRTGW